MSEPPSPPTLAEVIAMVRRAAETGEGARELVDILAALPPRDRREVERAFGVQVPEVDDFYEERPGRFELRWPLRASDPRPLAFEDLDRRTQFSILFAEWRVRQVEAQAALARGEVSEAEAIFGECLERADQLEVDELVVWACEGLLQVAEKRGDLDARRAWLAKAMRVGPSTRGSAVSLARRAAMLELEAGRPLDAERRLTALLDALGAQEDGAEVLLQHCGSHADRATVLWRMNRWADALADLDSAEGLAAGLPELRRAEALAPVHLLRIQLQSPASSPIHDPAAVAAAAAQLRALGTMTFAADLAEATLAFDARDWSRAASLAIRAGQVLGAMGWEQGSARCRLIAAEALLETDDIAATRAQLEPALDLFQRHGPPAQLALGQLLVARSRSAAGDHEGAWQMAVAALDGFDSLIRHFRVLEDQQRFIADKLHRYDQVFDMALATPGRQGVVRAWEVAERSKSFYLSQLVASQPIDVFDGVPADGIARLRELELRLDDAEQTARLPPSPAAEQVIQELSRSRLSLLTEMMRENPRWAAVRTPPRLDMDAELTRLAPEWRPVSYFWRAGESGGAMLHIFSLDGGGSPSRIEVVWSAADLAAIASAGERLARLTGPVDSLIPDALAARVLPDALRQAIRPGDRLLISPHGALRRLPLHAVGDPLVGTCAVQYAPTFALRALPRRRVETEQVLLLGCTENGWGDRSLTGVPEEIRGLADVWERQRPGRVRHVVLGPGDSLAGAGLAVHRWEGFDVIHCACHGDFPADRPFDAALRLGETAVRSSAFFGARLNASLVSLSACSLGRQTPVDRVTGDEWVGLYIPLLYAGAEHLLVSLWPANDRIAARCMAGLHERVAAGERPADALREAIEAIQPKTWASMWANWFLVGVD
jgi:hypothetical protein